jgi:hypothetical protein
MAASTCNSEFCNMLTALDESFMHQAALPFELCVPSDHRFFDRTVLTATAPDGSAGMIFGMGAYKNMNVLDGFAAVQVDRARQLNLRLSRELRPDMSQTLGPIRIEIVKPFEQIRYILESNDHAPFSFDMVFSKFLAPILEEPHVHRSSGRVTQDYLRFNQLMTAGGTIEIEGTTHQAERWFGWRDHSWGVRPSVGGFEPPVPGVTDAFPSAARAGGKGMVLFYIGFNVEDALGGGIQIIETADGASIYFTGHFGAADGKQSPVKSYEWSVETFAGTRAPRRVFVNAITEDGTHYEIVAEPAGAPWAYKGFGYDSGYNDGKGQGVWRSQDVSAEHDIYDISHPAEVIMPDGTKLRPNHREVPVQVTVNGRTGHGYMPFIAIGDVVKLRAG